MIHSSGTLLLYECSRPRPRALSLSTVVVVPSVSCIYLTRSIDFLSGCHCSYPSLHSLACWLRRSVSSGSKAGAWLSSCKRGRCGTDVVADRAGIGNPASPEDRTVDCREQYSCLDTGPNLSTLESCLPTPPPLAQYELCVTSLPSRRSKRQRIPPTIPDPSRALSPMPQWTCVPVLE